MNIPTEEEYNNAKEVVSVYENEQKRLLDLRLEEFKKDLTEYFKDNKLDGYMRVDSFELRTHWTGNKQAFDIITEPAYEECYGGDNDDDIKVLCEKHDVNASLPFWMYPK